MDRFCTKCGSKLKENTSKCEECGYISIDAGLSNVAEKVKNYDYKGKFNQIKAFAKEKSSNMKQKYAEHAEQEKQRREAEEKHAEVLRKQEEEIHKQAVKAEQKAETARKNSLVIRNSLSAKFGYSFTYGIKEFIERFNKALDMVIHLPQMDKTMVNSEFSVFFNSLKIQSINDFAYEPFWDEDIWTRATFNKNTDAKSVFIKELPQYNMLIAVSTDDSDNIEWAKIYCHAKYIDNEEWLELTQFLFVIITIALFNDETYETALFKITEAVDMSAYYAKNGSKAKGKSMSTQAQYIIDMNTVSDASDFIYSYTIIPTNMGAF